MAIRDDFVLRILELMGNFLSSLISGKKMDPKEMESASGEKIGLPHSALISMDGPTLLGILRTNPDTFAIKAYLAAALLVYEAQNQNSLGRRAEAVLNYKKALFLLNHLDRMEGVPYIEDIKKLIDIVQKRL